MTGSNVGDHGKTIHSIETAFSIIEYLAEHHGAGVTEIADHLGLSKSTVHNHLSTLRDNEYVVHDGDQYIIGYRFLTLGGQARLRSELYEIAKPEINWLIEETGESACVATEENGRIVYLYQARGAQAVTTDSHTGTRLLPHCTALGKSILAASSNECVESIIERYDLPKRTENTITSRAELDVQLEAIRERGYALDDEERIEGLRCVAAPVTDGESAVGALSVSGPVKRLQGEQFRVTLPELVRRAVRVVEINLMYS